MTEAACNTSAAGIKDDRQRIILPEVLIDAIEAIAGYTDHLSASDRINAVLVLIFGWAWYERQESIDPTRIAIPANQWEQICDIVSGPAHTDAGTVNIGLEFVGRGPGSYQEQADPTIGSKSQANRAD